MAQQKLNPKFKALAAKRNRATAHRDALQARMYSAAGRTAESDAQIRGEIQRASDAVEAVEAEINAFPVEEMFL